MTLQNADENTDQIAQDVDISSSADVASGDSKRYDLAALLPIIGAVLFITPFIPSFIKGAETSLTTTAVYIFSVWALLIVLGFVLTRKIQSQTTSERQPVKGDE